MMVRQIENIYRLYKYFPYDKSRSFELYLLEIEPSKEYSSSSHGENTYEYITVSQGELTMLIDDEEFVVNEKNSIRFATDRTHTYRNNGTGILYLQIVLYWEGAGFVSPHATSVIA